MRRRIVEVFAVVIGAALVVFYYLDRQPAPSGPPAAAAPSALAPRPADQPGVRAQPVFPPVVEAPAASPGSPVTEDAPARESAEAAWEAARAEVAAVRSGLSQLDARFDEKDAEFARLEAEGADPEVLKEQMLIFLDGLVEEYDELEGRLAAAEAAEQEAAEALEALGGSRS